MDNTTDIRRGLGAYTILVSCIAYVCGAMSFQGSMLIMVAALALNWEEEVKINTMQAIVLDTLLYVVEKITLWLSSGYTYMIGFLPYGNIHTLLRKINIFGLTNSFLNKIEVILFIYFAFKAIKGGVVKIPWVTKFVQRALFDKVNLAKEVDKADAIISEKARKMKETTVSQARAVKKDVTSAVKNTQGATRRSEDSEGQKPLRKPLQRNGEGARRNTEETQRKPLRSNRENREVVEDDDTISSRKEVDDSDFDFSSFGSSDEDILD